MSIWTDDDVWEYIRRYHVPYSPLYDLTYQDECGNVCKMKRNGCIGCYTDYGRKSSHMYVLRQTHPERWEAVMKYGMAAEIQKIRQTSQYRPTQQNYTRLAILDAIGSLDESQYSEKIAWAIGNRPCAFD